MLARLPDSDIKAVRIETPFGTIKIDGRRVSFSSQYKIPDEALGLFQATVQGVDSHKRSKIHEHLRKPIHLLSKPNKAV